LISSLLEALKTADKQRLEGSQPSQVIV